MNRELKEFKLTNKIKAKLKNKNLLKKEFQAGKNAQEIMGFNDKTMAKFYRAAYHLFQEKRYADAANAFLFLVTLCPENHDYWLGFGMSTQLCNDFETAIDAYEMAAICDVENPVPYFFLGKCLFSIHDRESSVQALEMAIEYSEGKNEYTELNQQAHAALNVLSKFPK